MDAPRIIADLRLAPHPEGGWYREVYRSSQRVATEHGSRAALTTIYYLLERQQFSRWHVVDADEVWHFYAGAPLELFSYHPESRQLACRLLSSPGAGGEPVSVIGTGVWQAARSLGDYSLVGCSVAPGFEYSGFQLISSVPQAAEHFSGVLSHLRHLL